MNGIKLDYIIFLILLMYFDFPTHALTNFPLNNIDTIGVNRPL